MPLAQSHRRAAHWEIVQLSTNCRIAIEVETPSQLDGVFVQKLSCEKILPPAAFPWLCDAMYTRVAAVSFVPWRLEAREFPARYPIAEVAAVSFVPWRLEVRHAGGDHRAAEHVAAVSFVPWRLEDLINAIGFRKEVVAAVSFVPWRLEGELAGRRCARSGVAAVSFVPWRLEGG